MKSTRTPNLIPNGFNTTDDEADAERAILIVNTNSPTDTNNFSSVHSSRSSTTSTSNVLLYQTDTTSNNTSLSVNNSNLKHFAGANTLHKSALKTTPIKIVASAESLSSVNTLSQSVAPLSNQQQQNQKESVVVSPTSSRGSSSTNSQTNFKTFKTLTFASTNSPTHQQSCIQASNSPCLKKHPVDLSSSYRTMPSSHGGIQQHSGTLNGRSSHSKVASNFDQKPLNLPVNELFKRYELKRHAADSTTFGNNLVGSMSSIHSSLGSLQFNQYQNSQLQKKLNNAYDASSPPNPSLISPRLASKSFKSPTHEKTNPVSQQVTDKNSFFKDETDYKANFLSNPSIKQQINV